MRKAAIPSPSESEVDDLLPEYRFDYRKAKPNRFASEGAKTIGTKKAVTQTVKIPPRKKSK